MMISSLSTLVMSGLVGTAFAAGAAGTHHPSVATVKPCGAPQLSARLIPGSPGAGQRYATLTLTNISHVSCRTGGYVGLGLQSAAGRPVVTHTVRIHRGQVHGFTLAPRARASSQLHWGAIEGTGDRSGGPCFVAPRRILVTPPNAYRSLLLTWKQGQVCEAGRIDVTPLVGP